MKHSEIPMRNDTAKQIRNVRKILKSGLTEPEANMYGHDKAFLRYSGFILLILLMCGIFSCQSAHAYTLDQWANAIGKAENSKTHPYGIMVKYRHTSPRQACKNTVWHQWRLYKESGLKTPFLAFLGASYCPVGASNDPQGLNVNWQRNVAYFLKEGV